MDLEYRKASLITSDLNCFHIFSMIAYIMQIEVTSESSSMHYIIDFVQICCIENSHLHTTCL